MIPFLIALTIWTAAFVAIGVTYEAHREPDRPAITHHKEQSP